MHQPDEKPTVYAHGLRQRLFGDGADRSYGTRPDREQKSVVRSIREIAATLEIRTVPFHDDMTGRASRFCNRTADSASRSCY